jgi:hypothetical protein
MESTLSMKKSDFEGEVGFFLGYGRGSSNGETAWTTAQQSAITSCVKSGLRNFYFPAPLPGDSASHSWSFLKPVATLTLAEDANELYLPEDFGGLMGEITLFSSDQVTPWIIPNTGEGRIRQAFNSTPTATGRPQMVAIVPMKGTSQANSSRSKLSVYPTADQDYSLQMTYFVLPDYLTSDFPYCYGDAKHHETILESCLAVAEKRLDDMATVHHAQFIIRLASSVSMDRMNQPRNFGPNQDRSDAQWTQGYGAGQYYNSYVTYNGTRY